MWSERYDRELKDIFKLQDEIAIRNCEGYANKHNRRRNSSGEILKAFLILMFRPILSI